MRSSLVLLVVASIGAPIARGDVWTSADGAISVRAPPAPEFEPVSDPIEPFLALWISRDATHRFGVMKMSFPRNAKLRQSEAEEGLAEEAHGKITASSTIVKNGREIWLMSVEGTAEGANTKMTQAVALFDGVAYKVMAGAVGNGPANEAAIGSFIDSLTILTAAPLNSREPISNNERISKVDLISQKVGGAGLLLLIAALVLRHAIRRSHK